LIKFANGGRDFISSILLISGGGVYGIFLKNGAFLKESLKFCPDGP
jgi:hypothetical protein